MSVEMVNINANQDDDADVFIESDEIQHVNTPSKSQASSTSQPSTETTKSPWPSYSHTVGFGATHTPQTTQRITPNYKQQPRLMSTALDKHPDVPEIIRHIEQGHRILICTRGAPGSGKSYLARSIIDRTMNGDYDNHVFSTDDFFYDRRTKRYLFDRSKLSQAHESNQFRVAQRTLNGWSPIIIDNTNMKWWEMFPYFKSAVQYSYIIKILEPNTPWRISVGKLAQRNKHGVDQEAIARMLSNYEPGSVDDILRAMQIHNYSMVPQMRIFPEIQNVPQEQREQASGRSNDSGYSRFEPKDQRSRKYESNQDSAKTKMTSTNEAPSVGRWEAEQWPAFEEEQTSFWNNERATKPTSIENVPKPQRSLTNSTNIENMCSILQDKTKSKDRNDEKGTESAKCALKKHKKECANENKSFQEIRQIYPQIPVALLWDLFEKCNGDANWTMDILLNESETKDLQTLNTQEEIDGDNFACDCEKPALSGTSPAVDAIPAEWLKDSRASALPPRSQRKQKSNIPCENEVVKHIEQQFVISDRHYSDHSRKIRDIRRGATATATSSTTNNNQSNEVAQASSSIMANDNFNEDDEMIEIDLGIELVCQLDKQFGSNTFKSEHIKDIKTKVFMPKSLGQQLYATWIESLYHQIEEQKQQSIKDDEEFAKELQVKQPKLQHLFDGPQSNAHIQNIADMEYAWKAYNCDSNEWKQQSREDLAMKLTKAKLFEIFPNVEHEQLINVFIAYENNFAKTVDFFKESLKSEIDTQLQTKSQELVTHVRDEAQAVMHLTFHNINLIGSEKFKCVLCYHFRYGHQFCQPIPSPRSTGYKKSKRPIKLVWKRRNGLHFVISKSIVIWRCITHI